MDKTAAEIRESLKKNIAYENPKIDLTNGNVATDLGVNAFADELSAVYTETDRIRQLYLLESTAFTDKEADQLAASYGIYRLVPTAASGTVTFCATSLPSAGSVFTIPVGTLVTTSGENTTAKQFVTTATGVISATTPLNPSTNYYEVLVSVQATATGSSSNVGAGSINTLSSAVTGISAVYNENAIVNGTDEETTEELIERIKLKMRGFVYGTVDSYLSKVYEDPRVLDALVVDPDSEYAVRGAGCIDIYVLADAPSAYTQTVTDMTKSVVTLTKTPVDSTASVLVTFDDGSTAETGSFTISPDYSSVWAGSYRSQDTLVWNQDYFDQTVKQKSYYTISYSYNGIIGDLQTTFNTGDYKIITADVMIKTTYQVDAAMDFDIVTLPGYDGSAVRNSVKYAIDQFVNNLKLNQALRQSDIIGLVEGVDGVDYVKLPMRRFSEADSTGVYDVEASPLEYIRIDVANDVQIG